MNHHATTRTEPTYETLTDADLLVLAREQPEAFARLYERHAEPMLRFFLRRTLDADVAAELTAETFAEAFACRARYRRTDAGGAAWLYGIGHHELSRYHRSGRVEDRARARLGMPRRSLDVDDYERVEELADLGPLRALVQRAVRTLSEEQRRATELRVVEGRPYTEVAAALGCSEETARARVSRGLRRLATELEPHARELMEVD
jgi:RNA polymerase sigma factor (sigma-70 family)